MTCGIKTDQFSSAIRMLKALNPLEVMDRGFSIVYKEGNVANSVNGLEIGETLQVRLQDGTVETVSQVNHEEGRGGN